MNKDTSKAKGMLFGLAIGDALGYPTEFMNMAAIRDEFIKWRNSPENNRAPGNA